MNTDLIFPILAGAAVAILLGIWKTGRAVALAALKHPLRTNVIYVDGAGNTHVVAGSSANGRRPEEASAEAQKESRAQKEEKENYSFANSRH